MSEEKENKVEVKPAFQGIDDSGMDFQYEEDVNKLNYWFYRKGSICGCSGSSGSGSGGASNGINYVGISSTDPLGGIVTINGVVHSPSKNDMVVYDTKEYLYRDDGHGNLGWFELGDETQNDLVWQED